ncbi:hypothetical protein HBI03_245190 [Parastagonospora nodorum]|nr:hypothetical protein HBI03_245190 [Parastagonospora nodorum]
MHASLRKELEARYSLLNLSVYDLVEKLELEAQLRKASKEEELAKTKKEKREKESLYKSRDSNRILHSRRLTDAYILYFKELLSNNSRIFANAISIGKTQAIVLTVLIEHFCFFSNFSLENIGRLTKEKVIKMQINTTNAISKALTAANKLIILEANTPAVHSKAIKHYLALLAAQFIIVCSFRKVDKHIFRAYNTISVIAQQTIICKGSSYIEKRRQTIFNKFYNCKLESTIIAKDSVTSNRIYKIEDIRNIITNIKHNASEHKLSYKDILEKEGFNKLEASRYVIFNCFKMQAIFKIYSSYKVKHFTLNSVKDLFTNLSKDYFLSIAAEDIVKAANILLLLKEVCAKILIESYKLIMQAIIVALIAFAEAIILIEATHVLAEIYVSIVYFNLDSKLELKVLSK